MELQLKNVGMIKEANVKIDGLTVIAGENDTGKSTVGKTLFFIEEFGNNFNCKENYEEYRKLIAKENLYFNSLTNLEKELDSLEPKIDKLDELEVNNLNNLESGLDNVNDIILDFNILLKKREAYTKILKLIGKLKKLSDNELIEYAKFSTGQEIKKKFKKILYFDLYNNSTLLKVDEGKRIGIADNKVIFDLFLNINLNTIFIETPLITSLISFFTKLDIVQNNNKVKYDITDYPYTFKSLYKQLKLSSKKDDDFDILKINEMIKKVINGSLIVSSNGDIEFKRNNENYNIISVATGIKSFGIIQILIDNGWLTKDAILILDEPEVHLHPKWQLEMAKIIVELVKNGVKVLVNSHSPYMIEALKRYSEVEEIEDKTNFYLAEDGYIKEQDSLENIFEKLATPMRELKKLKIGRYLND